MNSYCARDKGNGDVFEFLADDDEAALRSFATDAAPGSRHEVYRLIKVGEVDDGSFVPEDQ